MLDAPRYTYVISRGLWYRPGEALPFAVGHSGAGDAMNDPARCGERDVGPIPPGLYVLGPAERHPTCGPVSMRLYPLTLAQVLGRSPWSFLVHGPNATPDLTDDSKGCPILSRGPRDELAASDVRLVEVVEGEGPILAVTLAPEPVDSELEPAFPLPTQEVA